MNKKYTVFVSSTYEDLKPERQEVMQALLEMDCIPCGMELFPAADEEQFEFIKSIIDDCDYYVLILGGKYGSVNSDGISYTELEFRYALECNIPIISFVHGDTDNLPYYKCEHDEKMVEKLNNFRSLAKKRLCKFWKNKDELAGFVSRSMIQLIKRNPATGWVRADLVANEEALRKITKLYEENRELKNSSNPRIQMGTLASGKECIDVDFNVYNSGDFDSAIDSFSVKISWDNILGQIGPTLLGECNRYLIEESLSEVGVRTYSEISDNVNKALEVKRKQFVRISKKSFGEILIQFLALNYITVNHPNHDNEYLMSHESTYVLTELGRNVLIQLAAKRI